MRARDPSVEASIDQLAQMVTRLAGALARLDEMAVRHEPED